MTVVCAGIMSGTSIDGIDTAVCSFDDDRSVELLGYRVAPYDREQRQKILSAISGGDARGLSELNFLLGEWFANALLDHLDAAGVSAGDLAFVASHGQTIWHQPALHTLQMGEASVICERLGVPVVSDFRATDVAAGGQGAPLVPIADAMLFAGDGGRVLLNVGGIANVTWVPRAGELDGVIAFDTGPGVAIIDEVYRRHFDPDGYDANGERARAGKVLNERLTAFLEHEYFVAAPPKSTGREAFGPAYVDDVFASEGSGDDLLATAVEMTAESVGDQIGRWLPREEVKEVVASGGGARNGYLMERLQRKLSTISVVSFDDRYFDGDAKEAVSFAYLGMLTLNGKHGNVPAATGANGGRVLGKVTRP